MKKWYQPCGWILVAALALELSGCAQTSALTSRFSRKKDDQKLVDVDGKKTQKSTDPRKGATAKSDPNKNSDPAKARTAADTQLAQKSARPKTDPADAKATAKTTKPTDRTTELASAEQTAKPSRKTTTSSDPFASPEFEALAAKKAAASKKGDTDAAVDAQLASTKTSAAKQKSTADSSSIQEVAHKVEDTGGNLPAWAADEDVPAPPAANVKPKAPARSPARAVEIAAVQTSTTEKRAEENRQRAVADQKEQTAATTRAAAKADADFASISLINLCPEARDEVADLVRGLNLKDVEGLKRGVHRIGKLQLDAQAAAPALVYLLKHRDGFVRIHSALALAKMQASPPEAVQAVVDGLKSPDPGIRSFAAAVLAEMGPQAAEALTTLAESLNDHNGYVRLHAAEVLIRYDRWSYQALETLLAGLSDKSDENIRWLSTYSLAELAPESQETVDALIQATHDRVLKVQVGAVYALGEIGPFAKSASIELRKLADSTPHAELQTAILYALPQIEQ